MYLIFILFKLVLTTEIYDYARISYCNDTKKYLEESYEIIGGPHKENYGFATYDGNIIFAFRGSHNLHNWIADFEFIKSNTTDYLEDSDIFENALIHSGIKQSYIHIQNRTRDLLHLLIHKYPEASIKITGHSLGGAITTLCAFDFAYTYNLKIEAYTYGSPRLGNDVFIDLVNKYVDMKRYVNNADIVPHLPFENMDFIHPYTEYWIKKDKITICKTYDKPNEDPNCSASLYEYSIIDHTDYFGVLTSSC